jgi:hypothetical protein
LSDETQEKRSRKKKSREMGSKPSTRIREESTRTCPYPDETVNKFFDTLVDQCRWNGGVPQGDCRLFRELPVSLFSALPELTKPPAAVYETIYGDPSCRTNKYTWNKKGQLENKQMLLSKQLSARQHKEETALVALAEQEVNELKKLIFIKCTTEGLCEPLDESRFRFLDSIKYSTEATRQPAIYLFYIMDTNIGKKIPALTFVDAVKGKENIEKFRAHIASAKAEYQPKQFTYIKAKPLTAVARY